MSAHFRDSVANLFKAYPNTWIDGRQLQQVGGIYGWRTRVSDCRRQLGMRIENKQERLHRKVVQSSYCYIPGETA